MLTKQLCHIVSTIIKLHLQETYWE